jgi:hypothetical protein
MAYAEAVRAISSQAGAIDALRSRSAGLLGAASIATAFLGSAAAPERGLRGWGLVATCCFAFVGLLTVLILLPLKRWHFTLDPPKLVRMYREVPVSEDELYEDAAHSLNTYRRENSDRLERLYWAFRIASLLLVAGVVAWILQLKGTI